MPRDHLDDGTDVVTLADQLEQVGRIISQAESLQSQLNQRRMDGVEQRIAQEDAEMDPLALKVWAQLRIDDSPMLYAATEALDSSLSQFEEHLTVWGVVFGFAYAVACTETNPWGTREDSLWRALPAAREAFMRYTGGMPDRTREED